MIHIISFGYLHGPAPEADFTIDARRAFRDPHIDPRFRELNGFDDLVIKKVLATPGVDGTIANATALLMILFAHANVENIVVAVGCAGGRHRSVVMANEIHARFTRFQPAESVTLSHRDVFKPVVQR